MTTLFIGQNKIFLPETESTNSYAIDLLKKVNTTEGTVVFTDNQKAGRGQRGNSWISESSMNITLSVILKPTFLSVKNAFYLSKITALALHDVLTEMIGGSQFDIKIKWPNDIVVNKEKVAGILIENSFKEDIILWTVIGIGLNVNQVNFEGLNDVTSLKRISGQDIETGKVMNSILKYIEKWYLKLRSEKFDEIDLQYLEKLFALNTLCEFETEGNRIKGRIKGVNELGQLLVENTDRSVNTYNVKEIKMLY